MKKEQKERLVNDALNLVDEKFIEEAASVHRSRNKMWIPALAAAAVLLITAVIGIPALTKNSSKIPTGAPGSVVTGTGAPEGTSPADASSNKNGVTVINGTDYKDGRAEWTEKDKSSGLSFLHGLTDGKADAAAEGPAEVPEIDTADGPGIVTDPIVIDDPTFSDGPVQEPDPGQLTAGAWDDNAHYALFRTLFQKEDQGTTAGKFSQYAGSENRWFDGLLKRIAVTVKNGDAPVAGRKVSVLESGEVLASAVTNVDGEAFLFVSKEGPYQIVTEGDGENSIVFTEELTAPFELTVDLAAASLQDNVIELMFVIDVTGSMGDELSYLKSELADVVKKVTEANPDAAVRFSFLCYRDDSDEEKIYYSDFKDVTTPEGMKEQLDLLKLQDAMGGGDYEEAVDEALMFAAEQNWSARSTKLVFHFLDAPAHDTPEHRERYANAVRMAAEKGIRLCPVLASGSDTQTEYLTRAEAVLTGGTFVFITDDSGIGYSHHEPQLPDAVHEYLNALMIRLINGYYTGVFADPVPWSAE